MYVMFYELNGHEYYIYIIIHKLLYLGFDWGVEDHGIAWN